MKLTFHSCLLKTALLVIPLGLYLGWAAAVQAGGTNEPVLGPVGPKPPDAASVPVQGYLKVYSATDEVNDGDLTYYYPHSSYVIYATDGQLFKRVENHISRDDQSPEVVELPIGSYTVVTQSERDGRVSIRVIIKAGRRTILNLERGRQENIQTFTISQAVVAPSGQLIGWRVQPVRKQKEGMARRNASAN